MLIQEYSKPRSQTKKDSYIPRFIPKDLGKMVLLYLKLLKPLHFRMLELAEGKEKALTSYPFLFTHDGKSIDPSKFATLFGALFKEFGKMKFGISSYRQLSCYIADSIIGGKISINLNRLYQPK